jgi:hypothetical protein
LLNVIPGRDNNDFFNSPYLEYLILKRAAYPSALLVALTLAACGGNGPDMTKAKQTNDVTPANSAQADSSQAVESSVQASPNESTDAIPEPVDPSAESGSTGSTAVAAATVLYVATTGSDSNPGTSTQPLKTILKASQLAQPGTVVYVAPGTYSGGLTTAKSGTSSARIRYVSSTKHRAILVAPSGSTAQHGWLNTGNYVDIDGFQIDGRKAPLWRNGILTRASYGSINNNYVPRRTR